MAVGIGVLALRVKRRTNSIATAPPVTPSVSSESPKPSFAVGSPRPPTPFEAALIRAMEKRGKRNAPAPTTAPASSSYVVAKPSVDVDFAAAQLARTDLPSARRREVLASLLKDGSPRAVDLYLDQVSDVQRRTDALVASDAVFDPPIDALLSRLQDPLVERRLAAARALGWIDGPVVTKRLKQMAERNQGRREAMIALAGSRGYEARYFVYQAAERGGGPLESVAKSVLAQRDFAFQQTQ